MRHGTSWSPPLETMWLSKEVDVVMECCLCKHHGGRRRKNKKQAEEGKMRAGPLWGSGASSFTPRRCGVRGVFGLESSMPLQLLGNSPGNTKRSFDHSSGLGIYVFHSRESMIPLPRRLLDQF